MELDKQVSEVLVVYENLVFDKNKNEFSGELFISEKDSYELTININPYPYLFPIVIETAGRIPKKLDRHIYSDSKSCCFTTNAKAQILLQTKISSLSRFIKHVVIPYLQNNSYYEIERKYNTDEYAHGPLGIIEGYRDILKIEDGLQIARLIHHRLSGKKLKISNNCYCNSGMSLKRCTSGLHDKSYRDFRKIDKALLVEDFETYFLPFLKKTRQLNQ